MKNIQISGNAHYLYPADMIFGLLWLDENRLVEIPKLFSYAGEWGEILSYTITLEPLDIVPLKLSLLWISLVEAEMYYLETALPKTKICELLNHSEDFYTHIVVGMGMYGKCAIWVAGQNKSTLVCTFNGEVIKDISYTAIDPYQLNTDIHSHCQQILKRTPEAIKNLNNIGLPKHNLFKQYMTQYYFRYNVIFNHFKNRNWIDFDIKEIMPTINNIRDLRFDGTYSLFRNIELSKRHMSGIPKRIMVEWSICKKIYSCYFFLFEEVIIDTFNRFYGAHPETKADFIIRIDAENKKYELALFRQGLKEPLIIPEAAYQLIVFKNNFEDYRSENYNQPRGAWIW